MDPLFTGKDLELIEALVFDPSLKPSYDFLRESLEWDDERPDGLTPDAYNYLLDLFIARSLLHKGLTFDHHPFNPDYCKETWDRAICQGLKWTGFKRLTLSGEDKAYYEQMREKARKGDLI